MTLSLTNFVLLPFPTEPKQDLPGLDSNEPRCACYAKARYAKNREISNPRHWMVISMRFLKLPFLVPISCFSLLLNTTTIEKKLRSESLASSGQAKQESQTDIQERESEDQN